jgi:outer membrane protein OmpA-like peptidoglycan-associated protein
VTEKETQLLDTGLLRLNNVNFDTGKSTIKPESYPALDEAGEILSRWNELKIEVGGHTDSQGDEIKNQALSEARAQAVLDYLTAKFSDIKRDQFTAKGYGEGSPIAENNSAAGRAQNRRVELKVLNREVLKKETEKPRMLKQGEK